MSSSSNLVISNTKHYRTKKIIKKKIFKKNPKGKNNSQIRETLNLSKSADKSINEKNIILIVGKNYFLSQTLFM